jgi:cytochrome b6-f complex iron-sulfur subunit
MTAERETKRITRISRRELLSYLWAAAVALFGAELAGVLLVFARPRFKEGEFGGRFELGRADRFDEGSVNLSRDGRFFLVNEGGEFFALYQICTHLGCLMRWDEEDQVYICPCHGAKFAKDGSVISGPIPRDLDRFAVEVVDGRVVVDTGKRTLGASA